MEEVVHVFFTEVINYSEIKLIEGADKRKDTELRV